MRVAGYWWPDVTCYACPPACPLHAVLALCGQLGVPLPSQQEYVTKGTVRHPKSGKIGISREEGNVTFSRSGLAQYLIDQAKVGVRLTQHHKGHWVEAQQCTTQQLLLLQHTA